MAKEKPSRIVMIAGLFHPVVGGAELVCQKLAQGLIKQGMSVTVLTSHRDGLPDYEIIDGIHESVNPKFLSQPPPRFKAHFGP